MSIAFSFMQNMLPRDQTQSGYLHRYISEDCNWLVI